MPNARTVADELNSIIQQLGMDKAAANINADPGTTQPAEQEAGRSNIEPAVQGAHGAENSASVKAEVPATAENANPSEAETTGAKDKSNPENIGTAATTGEAPNVEKAYGSSSTSGNYPGTSHPADSSNNEKYSAERLRTSATAVMEELTKMAEAQKQLNVDDLTLENAHEKLASVLQVTDDEFVKTAGDKSAAATQTEQTFLVNFVKSASLIGELTADYLDGIAAGHQKAAGLEGELPPEDLGDEGLGDEGLGEEAEIAEIVAEAEQLAAEMGVEPEEVLEAALADVEGGDDLMGGEEMIDPATLAELEQAIADEATGGPAPEDEAAAMEVLAGLQEKAQNYDQLMEELTKLAQEDENAQNVQQTVKSAMDAWFAEKSAAIQAGQKTQG